MDRLAKISLNPWAWIAIAALVVAANRSAPAITFPAPPTAAVKGGDAVPLVGAQPPANFAAAGQVSPLARTPSAIGSNLNQYGRPGDFLRRLPRVDEPAAEPNLDAPFSSSSEANGTAEPAPQARQILRGVSPIDLPQTGPPQYDAVPAPSDGRTDRSVLVPRVGDGAGAYPGNRPNRAAAGQATENPAMRAVSEQAESHVRRGLELAERGAIFSARAQFLQALHLIAQAMDEAEGAREHSLALAAARKALSEVDDFVPEGSAVGGEINVAAIVSTHRTTLLKSNLDPPPSPLVAAQMYYTFAQEKLIQAGGHEPVASWALYALGRMYLLDNPASASSLAAMAKSLVTHQAALGVDGRNHMAANESGVILARLGQLGPARAALERAAQQARRPEVLHNLSVVCGRLGEHARAEQLERDAQLARASAGGGSNIQWVAADDFARDARDGQWNTTPRPATSPAASTARPSGPPLPALR